MTQIDGGLRALFRQKLTPSGFHCNSIETGGTGKGIPDFEYCARSVSGWVEFKATKYYAVQIQPEQVAWAAQRRRAGGRCYFAVRRKHTASARKKAVDELWLIDGEGGVQLKEHGLKNATHVLGIWGDGPKNWDWDQIKNILLGL